MNTGWNGCFRRSTTELPKASPGAGFEPATTRLNCDNPFPGAHRPAISKGEHMIDDPFFKGWITKRLGLAHVQMDTIRILIPQALCGISFWSVRLDSNQRPPAPKAGALPGCATHR